MKPILVILLIFISCFKSYSGGDACFLIKVQIETKNEIKTGYIYLSTNYLFINTDSFNIRNYLTTILKTMPETKNNFQLFKYILPIHVRYNEERIFNYISFDDAEIITTSEVKSCKLIKQLNCDYGTTVSSYLKQSDSTWINSKITTTKTLLNGVCDVTFLLYNKNKDSQEFFEKMQAALQQENRMEYDRMLKACRNYKIIIINECSN
ncbi:MAG: hypothetical protein ABI772_14340 [Bacteroidota bacterium]